MCINSAQMQATEGRLEGICSSSPGAAATFHAEALRPRGFTGSQNEVRAAGQLLVALAAPRHAHALSGRVGMCRPALLCSCTGSRRSAALGHCSQSSSALDHTRGVSPSSDAYHPTPSRQDRRLRWPAAAAPVAPR